MQQHSAVVGSVQTSPSLGPDLVFQTASGRHRVHVKLMFDGTFSKYYHQVVADRAKDCDYQVVFFMTFPGYSYPPGCWYGSTRREPARSTNVVGIDRQMKAILDLLGPSPAWPASPPARHDLPWCNGSVSEATVRERFRKAFQPVAPWEFEARKHLREARVGAAVWDWTK